jgi:hypothetical protein
MKPIAEFKLAFLFAATVGAFVSATTLLVPSGKSWAHDGGSNMHHDAHSSAVAPADEVEIVLREGGQPLILKGPQTHGHVIALVAGQPTVLAFRNEDTIPREFVSPLFTRSDIHFVGRATGIFRKDAVGFRLNPGSTLTLEFMAPYTGFPKMYDLIWCRGNHDKEPDTELQELLIVITEEQ